MEGLVIDLHPFLIGDSPEIPNHVGNRDTVEIVCLAAGKNSRENLVLFGSGEDENRVGRRLFKSLQEGIECRGREHMDLVYDIDAVFTHLRRYLDLLHQCLDVIDAVV